MKYLLLSLLAGTVFGQTQVDLRTQTRDVDFSAAISTRPEKTGTVLPATCNAGELFFKTNAASGSNLYGCVATNTWAVLSGGSGTGGGSGPGVCSASNASAPNALTCAISGFTLASGSMVNLFVTNATTSSTVTLTINGGATATIFRGTGNAPSAGELAPSSTPILLTFNGSIFQIVDDSYEAGGTNCLTFSRTAFPWTMDINTSCVPQLSAANAFTGYNNLSGGQIRLPESTVASLPSAPSNTGKEFIVTDGTSASDCTAGGGSTVVNMCRSNGTTWVLVGGGGGTSVTDACNNSGSYWAPLGLSAGVTFSVTANTMYGWFLPANSPLCTVNGIRVATNGSGHFTLTLWNATGTAKLFSTTVASMVTNNWQNLALPASSTIQPNTPYFVTLTGDNTGDQIFGASDANFLGSTTSPAASQATFTCANPAAWSAGVPNLPATCGTRTAIAIHNLTLRFF